ncbi:MAG: hypothetical protein OEY84_00895 [Rhodospirillaceae bacterium]|nr:hypothetical protein [Rhodospirillaceae bacterium]
MMATKPPTNAISSGYQAPRNPSLKSDPFSSSLALIDLLGKSGLLLAPANPEDALIKSVAKRYGVSPMQAKGVYRTIAGFGEKDMH